MKEASSRSQVPLSSMMLAESRNISLVDALRNHEDEDEAQRQVDEIHRLDQANDQEHDVLKLALCLRLAGDPGDGGVAGQAVADGGPHGSPPEGEAEADPGPGQSDGQGPTARPW